MMMDKWTIKLVVNFFQSLFLVFFIHTKTIPNHWLLCYAIHITVFAHNTFNHMNEKKSFLFARFSVELCNLVMKRKQTENEKKAEGKIFIYNKLTCKQIHDTLRWIGTFIFWLSLFICNFWLLISCLFIHWGWHRTWGSKKLKRISFLLHLPKIEYWHVKKNWVNS